MISAKTIKNSKTVADLLFHGRNNTEIEENLALNFEQKCKEMFKMAVLRCTVIIFAGRIAKQYTKLMYAKCQFDTSQGVCLDIGIRRLCYLDDMKIFFVISNLIVSQYL